MDRGLKVLKTPTPCLIPRIPTSGLTIHVLLAACNRHVACLGTVLVHGADVLVLQGHAPGVGGGGD